MKTVFRIQIFFPDPNLYQPFFLSPDLDRPKIRILSGKIRIQEKNVLKLELTFKKSIIFHI